MIENPKISSTEEIIEEIRASHAKLHEILSNESFSESIEQNIIKFLTEVAEKGALIEHRDYRSELRTLIRYWASFIADRSGYYPPIRLEPFQKAGVENLESSNDRLEIYRQAILTDPYIAYIDNPPIKVEHLYMRQRLRLHNNFTNLIENQEEPSNHSELFTTDVVEVIQKYSRCIIVGQPGSGKTTLLKFLAYCSAGRKFNSLPDLPVFLQASRFTPTPSEEHSNNILLDWMINQWHTRYGFPKNEAENLLLVQLQKGNILVMLDGLDEIHIGKGERNNYTYITEAIINFTTQYPKNPIIITSRPANYINKAQLSGFTTLELLEINLAELVRFIEMRFALNAITKSPAELISQLMNNFYLQGLVTNPLFLMLIISNYLESGTIITEKFTLYDAFADLMLRNVGQSDITKNIMQKSKVKEFLGSIAWKLQLKASSYLTEEEITEAANNLESGENLYEPRKSYSLAELQEIGLLKNTSEDVYNFTHLIFQEYFAAYYAIRHSQIEALLQHRTDSRWQEIIFLYAQGVSSIDSFLNKLLELPEDIFYTNLMVAAHCLTAKPNIQNSEIRLIVTEKLFEALQSKYYVNYSRAALFLIAIYGFAENEAAKRFLNVVSKLNNPIFYLYISQRLSSPQEDKTIIKLLTNLLSDNNIDKPAKYKALKTFSELGRQNQVSQLVNLLSDNNIDVSVRQAVAETIGSLATDDVVPAVLPLLSNKAIDERVRYRIVKILGKFSDKDMIDEFLLLLADKSIGRLVRYAICSILRNLEDYANLKLIAWDKSADAELIQIVQETLGPRTENISIIIFLESLLLEENLEEKSRQKITNAINHLKLPIQSGLAGLPLLLSKTELLLSNIFSLVTEAQIDYILQHIFAENLIIMAQDSKILETLVNKLLLDFDIFSELHEISQYKNTYFYWKEVDKIIRAEEIDGYYNWAYTKYSGLL